MKKEKGITSDAVRIFYEMFREGEDIAAIAKETGYTENAVRHWIDKNPGLKKDSDLKIRKRGRPPICRTKAGIEEKAAGMYKKGMSGHEIGKELGVSANCVMLWLRKSSDPEVVIRNDRGRKKTAALEAEVLDMYKKGWSSTQISSKLGISSGTVRNWLHDNAVAVRPKGCGVRAVDKTPEVVLDNMELPEGLKWIEDWTPTGDEVRIPVKKTAVQRLVGWAIDKLKKYQKEC